MQNIRFEKVEIDLTGIDKINELSGLVEKAKPLIHDYEENTAYILRIVLKGRTPLHSDLNNQAEIDAILSDLNESQLNGEYFTWIDSISVETQLDIDIDKIRKGNDFMAEILKLLDKTNPEELFADIESEISLTTHAKMFLNTDEEDKMKVMEKVKWMLLDQLGKTE